MEYIVIKELILICLGLGVLVTTFGICIMSYIENRRSKNAKDSQRD